MTKIVSYISRSDIYGNRTDLIVNYTTKEYYLSGSHAFEVGTVHLEMPIREVNRIAKEFKADGYTRVWHATVTAWAKEGYLNE